VTSSPKPSPPVDRALFVFAHQDDEYAAIPWILEEVAHGTAVACLYLTDGGSRVDPAVRDAESRNVLQELGVRVESFAIVRTERGRIADRELAARSCEAVDAIEGWIERSSFAPQRLYAPSYEGGHPDHDAAHLVAAVVAAQRAIFDEAWHFSLYNAYRCPRPFFATMRQLPTAMASRRAAMPFWTRWTTTLLCRRYRSQWRTWLGLFPGALYERAIVHRESVVAFDAGRLCERPHAGELLYERLFDTRYEDFKEQTRAVCDRLRNAT
jgi:LmbE family N-acetylglucosaminyl deacetylase